jgi:lipoyl(octanoyl) transferase
MVGLFSEAIAFRHLGRLDWDAAALEQERAAEAVLRGVGPETVLFVEHEPVYTRGIRLNAAGFRHGYDGAGAMYCGVPVRRAFRGGDVTYHGPGQLVVYPILRLPRGAGLGRLVELYQAIIRSALAELAIESFPREDAVGVWTGRGKIASIGVGLRRGVTRNGFAINVEVDPRAFELIVPCGRPADRVANVNDYLRARISVDELASLVEKHFIHAGIGRLEVGCGKQEAGSIRNAEARP